MSRNAVLLLSLASLLSLAMSGPVSRAQTPLATDSAHFIVNQGSHPVGKSDFSILTLPQGGYRILTHGSVALSQTRYSFSGEGSLDRNLAIQSENLNGSVNGSAVTFAAHNSNGTLNIDISAKGRPYRSALTPRNPAVFFPDFDLSAYNTLLALAASRPGVALTAFIPKQTGILSDIKLAPQPDAAATLQGKPLTAHHQSLTIGSVTSEMYYSSDNRILEVDIPEQAFAIVRDGFLLNQPPPPPDNAQSGEQPQQ